MAQAVTRLWPGAHYAIGPAIRDGFYYDFELPAGAHFSDDDLERIDAEMRAIIAEDQPFTRHEYSIDEGLALFDDQPFKRRDHRRGGRGADRPRTSPRSAPVVGLDLRQLPGVHRPVPRSARALHGAPRALPA